MATTRIMSLHTRADLPGGGTLIFPPFQRAAGPSKKRSEGTRIQPRKGLFKGVWGRCLQQADWTSRRGREVQFCIVGPTMPCLPRFSSLRSSRLPSPRPSVKPPLRPWESVV